MYVGMYICTYLISYGVTRSLCFIHVYSWELSFIHMKNITFFINYVICAQYDLWHLAVLFLWMVSPNKDETAVYGSTISLSG